MWNSFDKCKDEIAAMYEFHKWHENSGFSEKELFDGCSQIMSEFGNKKYMDIKTDLMVYILENAALEVCPNDFFADKINHGNVLSSFFCKRLVPYATENANTLVVDAMPLISCGAIEPSTDFGHIAPDWDFVIKNGIPGIIKRLETFREKAVIEGREVDYYDNCIKVYNAIISYMRRLSKIASAYGTCKMDFVCENLTALTLGAPETLAQAMQLTIIIYTVQTYIELSTVRSLGGLDRLYYPFYKKDLENGKFSESQLRELVKVFLMKLSALHATANTPFYICGRNADGTDATNDFTYVILEEHRSLGIYDPKIHVMYHPGIPRKLTELILDAVRSGSNSYVFVNVDLAARALEKIGIDCEDAKKVIVYGCYETSSEGEEIPSTCAGRINVPKLLDLFLFGGYDTLKGIRLTHKPRTSFNDFDELYASFKEYLAYGVERCMMCISEYEKLYPEMFFAPMLSASFKSSIEKGIDVFSGGAKYNNTSIVCGCIASVADSLAAIKRVVYDLRIVSLEELLCALKNNWKGYERLQSVCKSNTPKFANNYDYVDFFAKDICEFLASVINGKQNSRGGVFRFGMFSIDWRFRFGRATGASPDGRYSGEALSKNFSAYDCNDKKGVTAYLNSVLKVNAELIPDGSVADVVLHSSAATGEEGLLAMRSLLESYMMRDGFAIQFNVLSAKALKEAQESPEKHKNLQIRVCGWNSQFVDLSKKEQDEFIIQAENA